ncbi:hypothetical protein KSP39_PZI019341 [Platanthera zijinensis]|uniref:Uncharacterized protein n=1 Tax=Platanthera zijinensis TaxID=2320716 RepID=A0AAP0FXR2_9ASPA
MQLENHLDLVEDVNISLHLRLKFYPTFVSYCAMEKVLCLTRRRERFLVVAVVRFMQAVISRNVSYIFF